MVKCRFNSFSNLVRHQNHRLVRHTSAAEFQGLIAYRVRAFNNSAVI